LAGSYLQQSQPVPLRSFIYSMAERSQIVNVLLNTKLSESCSISANWAKIEQNLIAADWGCAENVQVQCVLVAGILRAGLSAYSAD